MNDTSSSKMPGRTPASTMSPEVAARQARRRIRNAKYQQGLKDRVAAGMSRHNVLVLERPLTDYR